jgi:hypothetical protein
MCLEAITPPLDQGSYAGAHAAGSDMEGASMLQLRITPSSTTVLQCPQSPARSRAYKMFPDPQSGH